MKKLGKWLLAATIGLIPGFALAQSKTTMQLSQENVTNFPSCGNNCISALLLRSFNNDIIFSTWNLQNPPLTGVTAGTYGPGLVGFTVGADGRLTSASGTVPGATLPLSQALDLTSGQTQSWTGYAGAGAFDVNGFLRQSVTAGIAKVWETGSAFNYQIVTGNLRAWAATTTYGAAGEIYTTAGNVYINHGACTTGSTPPTGGGTGIGDGTCLWDWETTTATVGKWNVQLSTQLSGSPGPSWAGGELNNFLVTTQGPSPVKWSAGEIRVRNSAANCLVASGDACHGLLISGYGAFSGTNGLGLLNLSGLSNDVWQTGIYLGPTLASLADIKIDDSAPIGIQLTGTYSSWAVQATGAARFTAETLGTSTGSSTTPTQLSFDTTISSVAGANPKIELNGGGYGASRYGFGLSAFNLDYMVPSGNHHMFYANGTQVFEISAGQIIAGTASGASATPEQLAFDTTTSSTPGSNPKINLNGSAYGVATNGFGVSTAGLDYLTQTGLAHTFYVNGVAQASINSTAATFNGLVNYNNGAAGATCTVTGAINIQIQGVAHKIPIC